MSKNNKASNSQLSRFLSESRNKFRQQYASTGMPSVLIAQNTLETYVEQGAIVVSDALALIRDQARFTEILLKAEDKYQKSEQQKLNKRIEGVERNTHWALALGISVVTGITFCLGGPFAGAWLQPTADELFKRKPTAQAADPRQPLLVQNITNQYVYTSDRELNDNEQSPASKAYIHESRVKLTCKNVKIDTYKEVLEELLQHGNVVTLEANDKKVSLCYRPNVRLAMQHQAQP